MTPWQRLAVELALIAASIGITWRLRRPTPVVTRISYPPVPLEPWEEAAEFGGDVGGEEGTIALDDEVQPIGTGDPEELCPRTENPADEEETCVTEPLLDPHFAPVPGSTPLAVPGRSPTWPVSTRHKRRLVTSYWTQDGLRGAWGRHFGAKRVGSEGKSRRHAGIDLFAYDGDPVTAPEESVVLAVLPFHHGTWAVYLRALDGRILTLGEIKRYSWRDYGIAPGVRVRRGQSLARVGTMTGGGQMLHFEIHGVGKMSDEEIVDAIREGEMQWTEDAPPASLRDPSAYLVDAATRTHRLELA